ncbi:MAG: hypothetical protein WB770_10205 [Acidimicrobiales bacterium]
MSRAVAKSPLKSEEPFVALPLLSQPLSVEVSGLERRLVVAQAWGLTTDPNSGFGF